MIVVMIVAVIMAVPQPEDLADHEPQTKKSHQGVGEQPHPIGRIAHCRAGQAEMPASTSTKTMATADCIIADRKLSQMPRRSWRSLART